MSTKYRLTRWDSIDDRLWGRLTLDGDCWTWTGPLTDKGYGQTVGHNRRYWYPHHLAYFLLIGDVPDGLVLDHLCRNRACANPYHLDPVPATVNTARGVEARWTEPCPNGHPATERKTIPSGKNVCTACRRESDRARDARDRDRRRAAARARYARSKGRGAA